MIDTILKYKLRNESAKEVEKPNRYNNTRNGNKEDTSKPSTKTGYFVNDTDQTSRARIYTYKSNLYAKTGSCSEENSSEEKDFKCNRKSHVENVNEDRIGSGSEEKEIGIHKCRRRNRVEIMNNNVIGWKYS